MYAKNVTRPRPGFHHGAPSFKADFRVPEGEAFTKIRVPFSSFSVECAGSPNTGITAPRNEDEPGIEEPRRAPLTNAGSPARVRSWSDYTGECNTKDPTGEQVRGPLALALSRSSHPRSLTRRPRNGPDPCYPSLPAPSSLCGSTCAVAARTPRCAQRPTTSRSSQALGCGPRVLREPLASS